VFRRAKFDSSREGIKKSQSIENRGMPISRIACPPMSKYRTPAALNRSINSSMLFTFAGDAAE
jgi:hypothetical protein